MVQPKISDLTKPRDKEKEKGKEKRQEGESLP